MVERSFHLEAPIKRSTCNGNDLSKGTTTAAGSLTGCQAPSPYSGAYDLSGNVWEWEDSCDGSGPDAVCDLRGGAFIDGFNNGLSCGAVTGESRNVVGTFLGWGTTCGWVASTRGRTGCRLGSTGTCGATGCGTAAG